MQEEVNPKTAICWAAGLFILGAALMYFGVTVFYKSPFSYPWAVAWHVMLLGAMLIPHRRTSRNLNIVVTLLHVPIFIPWLRFI